MATAAVSGPPGQPDIAYTPNHESHLARSRRRREQEQLSTSLPDGFPKELKSDLVWKGDTVSDTYNWSYELSDAERDEIHKALLHFQGRWERLAQARAVVASCLGRRGGMI